MLAAMWPCLHRCTYRTMAGYRRKFGSLLKCSQCVWRRNSGDPFSILNNAHITFTIYCSPLASQHHGGITRIHEVSLKLQLCRDVGHHSSGFHESAICFAGHNKWSKIKRKKGATDLERSKARGKLMDKIRSSVAAEGPNPTTNLKLSGLLAQAKSMEVPKASIESALRAATSASVREAVMYEGRGASGFLILIETLTDNRRRTRPEIRHILEKQSGTLGEPGSSSFAFEQKGVIQLTLTDQQTESIDPLELAIEVGAEDVNVDEGWSEVECGSGVSTVLLLCQPNDLNKVCTAVREKSLELASASVQYLPKSQVALNEQQLEKAEKLLNMLSDHPDVVGVHTNYIISDVD